MRGRPRHPDILTPAEWRVLDEVRNGKTNGEIAERLGLSINTVKYHVANILSKLEVGSREELQQWQRGTIGRAPRRFAWLKWPTVGAAPAAAILMAVVLVASEQRTTNDHDDPDLLIAFLGGNDAESMLRLVDARDGAERALGRFSPGLIDGISWSPDRHSIALLWDELPNCPDPRMSCPAPRASADLMVVDVSTGQVEVRATGIASNLGVIGWRGGTTVVQTASADSSAGPAAALYHLDSLNCSELRVHGEITVCLWWNPSNDSEQEIRIGAAGVDFNDANQVGRVLPDESPYWPRVSFDGRWVAWNRTDIGYQLRIARVPPPGTSESRYADLGRCPDPRWSPVSPQLLCYSNEGPEDPQVSIVVVDAERGTRTTIGTWPRVRDAVWSPDGQQIAFVAEIDNEVGEIYVVNADGTDLRRLTFNETWESGLAWAPE